MASQNAIIGDNDYGTSLPETTIDTDSLAIEKKAAKFSRTAEYKRLKEHMDARVKFYQTFLPDGRAIITGSKDEQIAAWDRANCVIAEFTEIMNFYETAQEMVKEDATK